MTLLVENPRGDVVVLDLLKFSHIVVTLKHNSREKRQTWAKKTRAEIEL